MWRVRSERELGFATRMVIGRKPVPVQDTASGSLSAPAPVLAPASSGEGQGEDRASRNSYRRSVVPDWLARVDSEYDEVVADQHQQVDSESSHSDSSPGEVSSEEEFPAREESGEYAILLK